MILFVLIGLFLAAPAAAENMHAQAELLLSHEVLASGETLEAAIQLKIERGWHLYWINPGDSGLASSVSWTVPAGFSAGEVQWPYPERFQSGASVNFGYKKETWLLTQITTPKLAPGGASVVLRAKVEWLACKEICVPGQALLEQELRLQSGKAKLASAAKVIEKARALVPQNTTDWVVQARSKGSAVELSLQAPDAKRLAAVKSLEFFPIDEGVFDLSKEPAMERVPGGVTVMLPRDLKANATPKLLRGVLVTPKGWDAKGRIKAIAIATDVRG